jgi:hypothetical protein
VIQIHSNIEPWSTISKKVFWDRKVELEVWRQRASECHRSYLPDAVKYMSAREFVYFYGLTNFKQDWPRLRASLDQKSMTFHLGLYDLIWSIHVGQSYDLKPVEDFFSPPRKRELYVSIAHFFWRKHLRKSQTSWHAIQTLF